MIRKGGRAALTGLIASVLALSLVGVADPARANPPVTYKDFEIALVNSIQAFALAPGWVFECPVFNTAGIAVDFRLAAGATESGIRATRVEQGVVSTGYEYRSTTQWIVGADDSTPYGFRKALRPRILKEAKLGPDVEYVSGPYAAWAARYTDMSVKRTLAEYRQAYESALHGLSIPSWAEDQGTALTFSPEGGSGGTWRFTRQSGAATLMARLKTDGLGRLISVQHTSTESGVTTYYVNCLTSDWTSQPVIEKPDPALVAPLNTIGPAAWRVSTSVLAVQLGKAIRKGVKASGDVTPSRIRGQAYIELTKRGLETTWKVTDLAKGAKVSLSDPLGGTVARCITVNKGKLLSKRC